ncbi:MAG: hypothetical protein IKD45_04135 [Clostridia bacterium]|nr:hypothetical protein [Clostridia bacterium]
MAREVPESRKAEVGKNLRRLIKSNPEIRTIARFSELHGCDVRTAKGWVKNGIDRLTTISEVAYTLGVSDLELILGEKKELLPK